MTSEETKNYLIGIFPGFAIHWEDGNLFIEKETGIYTHCGVLSWFTSYFLAHVTEFSDTQLQTLFTFVESHMGEDDAEKIEQGDLGALLDNAVGACFLEDIAGEGLTKKLTPYLGVKSTAFYEYWDK
ncbi:MAG: hypothetical protein JWM39_758 [Parcubacteria group bacterium]|jgi:hypothetical protein|nr:hypothetical protein [Parcubacteria group bacterium]